MAISPLFAASCERRKRESAKAALKAMRGYYSEYTALPSYGELARRMRFDAKSWAYAMVGRLIESGHVVKLPNGRLAPGKRFFDAEAR